MKKTWTLTIGGAILLILLSACAIQTASPTLVPTKTSKPSETPMPAVTATVIATLTAEPTEVIQLTAIPSPKVTPNKNIAQADVIVKEYAEIESPQSNKFEPSEPWLVYSSYLEDDQGRDKFFVMNLDGGGNTHIFSIRTHTFLGSRLCEPSPKHTYVACQYTKDLDDKMGLEKQILIYQLPNMGIIARLQAVSHSLASSLRAKGVPESQEYMYSDEFTTIQTSGDMMWSPNGQYLAYTGAVEGPTTDVYVFDTVTLQTKRLTDGTTQKSLMAWSPDNLWIIHSSWDEGGPGMSGGAEPAIIAIWSAQVETGEVHKLDDIDWLSVREDVLGWISPDTFLTISKEGNGIGAPYNHVRRINISDITSTMIFDDDVEDIVLDPQSQTLAFAIGRYSGENPGIYLLSPDSSQIKIDNREWDTIDWIPEKRWFVADNWFKDEVALFSSQGNRIDTFVNEGKIVPNISPDGKLLVFTGENSNKHKGFRIYDAQGEWLKHILPGFFTERGNLFWEVDSSGFWFIQQTVWGYKAIIKYSFLDDSVIQLQDNLETDYDFNYPIGLVNP